MQIGGGEEGSSKVFIIEQEPNPRFAIRDGSKSSSLAASKNPSFTIESERGPVQLPGTDQQVMFAHQGNNYDCGPCLVLNTYSVLGVPPPDTSVPGIRQRNNQLRAGERTQPLGDSDWFSTTDVGRMMRLGGLIDEPYSVKAKPQEAELRESIRQKIAEVTQFFVYSTTGRHFKGIYSPDGVHYYLVDSLHSSITVVEQNAIYSLITEAQMSNRPEQVAIVYKQNERV